MAKITFIDDSIFASEVWQKKYGFYREGLRGIEELRLSHADIEFLTRSVSRLDRAAIDIIGGPDSIRASLRAQSAWMGDEPSIAIAHGCTVRVSQIHLHREALANLCQSIYDTLWGVVDTNMYITGGGSIGLDWHIDHHDVFIIQLVGKKRWYIGNDRLPYSPRLPRLSFEKGAPKSPIPKGNFLHRSDETTIIMEPSDVLYMPAGIPHSTQALGNLPSCSISISIRVVTWMDVILAAVHEMGRTDFSLKTAAPQHPSEHDEQYLRAIFGALANKANLEDAYRSIRAVLSKRGAY